MTSAVKPTGAPITYGGIKGVHVWVYDDHMGVISVDDVAAAAMCSGACRASLNPLS
jgi:hypothetical protein